MTKPEIRNPVARLAALARRLFFLEEMAAGWRHVRDKVAELIQESYTKSDAREQDRILACLLSAGASKHKHPRVPPFIAAWLRQTLVIPGLVLWARTSHQQLFTKLGTDEFQRLITDWLAEPRRHQSKVLEAGVRYTLGLARVADHLLLQNSLGRFLSSKEEKMAEITFTFDFNKLPDYFTEDYGEKYTEVVVSELTNLLSSAPTKEIQGAVTGMLLLDEHFDFSATGFPDDVKNAWSEFTGRTRDKDIPTRAVYAEITKLIRAGSIRSGDPVFVFYQEFATAGRYAADGVDQIPPGHMNFVTQVKLGFEQYVSGKPALESLVLPPLTDADGGDVEIEAENIRAVGILYAALNLEEMRLFHVVDRITEIFMNGALPVGFDAGGKALDEYYWNREDRMNEAERRMQYSRVFGVPGGDVSKEIQINTPFEATWMRFLSGLAELERQRRGIDFLEGGNGGRARPLSLTGEYVRKAGRDLAANVSLYGWAVTQFAARRLNDHIKTALDILKQPSIQKAYGVTNPYQVIERVATTEFGVTPNIVRYRTMAEAGNEILKIVARYHNVWTRSNGLPLFEEELNDGVRPGDIKLADRDNLMNQTQFWLAVNGIKDDQVNKLSQPELSAYQPSIPAISGAAAGSRGNGHSSPDAMEKIKQMVSQGQVPTLDQLQQLIPGAKLGA